MPAIRAPASTTIGGGATGAMATPYLLGRCAGLGLGCFNGLTRFLEPTHAGTVPTNKVFVHWKQLTSDDRFPFLVKGLEARTV